MKHSESDAGEVKESLKVLDASLKMEFALKNPNESFIGPSAIEQAISEIDKLRADLATCVEIAKDIDLYTKHTQNCETYTNYPNPCTCGLSNLREALSKVNKP